MTAKPKAGGIDLSGISDAKLKLERLEELLVTLQSALSELAAHLSTLRSSR